MQPKECEDRGNHTAGAKDDQPYRHADHHRGKDLIACTDDVDPRVQVDDKHCGKHRYLSDTVREAHECWPPITDVDAIALVEKDESCREIVAIRK